ncbi:MAG TPA: hypothetical protein VK934_12900, partial [Fimbriimonas sp.]|nr:hypothetical protein [Fimbriimonas sp.]
VANAVAKSVDHEAVRAKAVMSKLDRIAGEAGDRREWCGLERSHERHKIGAAEGETINFIGMTVDRDTEALERRGPARREVVSVEVGQAKRRNVGQADPGPVETVGERARADAGVDEQDAGWRAKDRRIASRTAGKDAEFERHRSPLLIGGLRGGSRK